LQIADWQRQIDRDKKKSDAAVALFKKFQAEEAKILEVEAFTKSKPLASDILLRLGQTVPKNVAFDSLDLREAGLAMRISIRGSSADALGLATTYLEQLKADKELAQFFSNDDFQITNSVRNPNTGRLTVDMLLKLKLPAGATAPKK
jgi:hypothetical protein